MRNVENQEIQVMTAGMINSFTLGRHKFAGFLYRLSCVFFIIFISACSGGDSEPSSSETGTVAFNIALQNVQTTYQAALAMDGLSQDCQAAGVDTIRVEVYDGADFYLTDGGPWPCSAHKGSLQNVPEGSDRKIVILCDDSDGNVRYRGEHSGITVTRGETTHIGTVVTCFFIPTLSAPANGSNVTGDAVTLAWDAVETAKKYRIVVSKNSDLGSPIVNQSVYDTNFDLKDLSESEEATYYWQVHALDSVGNEGAESVIWSFTVNAPCMVTVPEAASCSDITAVGLTCSVTEEYDEASAGTVLNQSPEAGTSVACGSRVELVISLGPCMVDIPDVNVPDPESAITAADLLVGTITYKCSDTVTAGYGISTIPAVGASVLCGSQVSLVISSGQPTVPNVIGTAAADAIAAVDAVDNLLVGTITYECSETMLSGNVISQSPAAGAAPCNTQVNLLVSTGFCLTVVYVDNNFGSSEKSGRSWEEAKQTISQAIETAHEGDEIWVKQETYSLFEQIEVNKSVSIYGGFDGTEEDRDDRDWQTNITTVDGNDSVRCFLVSADAIIDGFIITRGYNIHGGGMYNYAGTSSFITNCTFAQNRADDGGGMYNSSNTSPKVTNCTFDRNSAKVGAGMYYTDGASGEVTGCRITGNAAISLAGGIHCYRNASPTISNCIIVGNTSADLGGAVVFQDYARPTITNCTISNNTAYNYGGGFCCHGYESYPIITNCIISGNMPDNITCGSNATVTYCDIPGEETYTGTGNINEEPNFLSEESGDFHLRSNSPCIDKGSNNASELPDRDFEGDSRIIDGDDDQTATVDMGADEYSGELAFIYLTDSTVAESYRNFLYKYGDFDIDLIEMNDILSTDFSQYRAILIGPNSGSGYNWGNSTSATHIDSSNGPIIGLGTGGSSFFHQLGLNIGYGHSMYVPDNRMFVLQNGHTIYKTPYEINIPADSIIQVDNASSHLSIYVPSPPANMTLFGRSPDYANHYLLLQEDTKYLLWGYSDPSSLNWPGEQLLINTVNYMLIR